jgi:hypothetical protein
MMGLFISVTLGEVQKATALGAQAGETTYRMPLGLDETNAAIQRQARKQVAQLVGKQVQPDGSIIDNPNPAYTISNTTRKKIQEAIHTSLALGEDIPSATKRVQAVIKSPARARLIAQQETAMAYTSGIHMYGQASGAIGKEWQDNGAVDICATNTAAGAIPFDEPYPGGVQHPTQHIGCKCYERLIYQNELDQNPQLFKHPVPQTPANLKPERRTPLPVTPINQPTGATFTKGNKQYTFDLNTVEQNVIADNNIEMTTAPAPGRTRWPSGTLGMYVERGTDYKAMHIRDPASEKSQLTFYHEIGHAIDHNLQPKALTDRYANTSALSQRVKDALLKDIEGIYRQRMYDQMGTKLDAAHFDMFLAGMTVHYKKLINGKEVGYTMKLPPSYRRYARSPSEVFAHGYGYYRTNPSMLKRIAPDLYKIYEELQ